MLVPRKKTHVATSRRRPLNIRASFWPLLVLCATEFTYLYHTSLPQVQHQLFTGNVNAAGGILLQSSEGISRCVNENGESIHQNLTLPTVAIFYHVYVPVGDDDNTAAAARSQKRALKIINQQLHQVGKGLTSIPNLKSINLYFTTVGLRLEDGVLEEICKEFSDHLECHHLKHVDDGFEEYTLTTLYEHCQQHVDDRVLYLHTKGSYHYSKNQNHWRMHMTDAVVSQECIERAHNENCDLCGLLFLPQPALHYTGNMFNAKCSYIRTLLHPKEFEKKMDKFIARGQQLLANGVLQSHLLNLQSPSILGSGRFAMEQWHGSHPDLHKICDISPHYRHEFWEDTRRKDRKPEDWKFDTFPRHPIIANWSHAQSNILLQDIMMHDALRKFEYSLLPGQLLKWYELYGKFPPESSWVWSWYPDGQFWKEEVAKHGGKALEVAARSLE